VTAALAAVLLAALAGLVAPASRGAALGRLRGAGPLVDGVEPAGRPVARVPRHLPRLVAAVNLGLDLAFDRARNYPLPNLFVSMLQRMDIETDRFASSTGAMAGLEMTKS